jgi:hypothetical protein
MELSIATARAREDALWHVPAALIVAIYLPASLLGAYVFRDSYAGTFLLLLAIFIVVYYTLFPHFLRILRLPELRNSLWAIGKRIDWEGWAWVSAIVFVIAIGVATFTVPQTPLLAALRGGSWLDIALARADFLVNREGPEALLRYLAMIVGRSILPFVVTYLYWSRHRFRHLALAALLLCYAPSLEKASPIFAFFPIVVLRALEGQWKSMLALLACMVSCIVLWTVLSVGTLHDVERRALPDLGKSAAQQGIVQSQKFEVDVGPVHDSYHAYFASHIRGLHNYIQSFESRFVQHAYALVNRVVWTPYITAYDWLKFHDVVLAGNLVLGRSIGVVSWLTGKPRVYLEQMVYQFQFGASPGGAGASNTVFFVDAKLNFGWLGAIAYCVLFSFFAAIVFSSDNFVAKVASITSFFTASLSPLSATLLSGGLFFYLVIALLTRTTRTASSNQTGADAPGARGDVHSTWRPTAHVT